MLRGLPPLARSCGSFRRSACQSNLAENDDETTRRAVGSGGGSQLRSERLVAAAAELGALAISTMSSTLRLVVVGKDWAGRFAAERSRIAEALGNKPESAVYRGGAEFMSRSPNFCPCECAELIFGRSRWS